MGFGMMAKGRRKGEPEAIHQGPAEMERGSYGQRERHAGKDLEKGR
jgi:hypothetical protein